MKKDVCSFYKEWLELSHLNTLPEGFEERIRQHVSQCHFCNQKFSGSLTVARVLRQDARIAMSELREETIERLKCMPKNVIPTYPTRPQLMSIIASSVFSVPFVAILCYAWIKTGFIILATYAPLYIANYFLVTSITFATFLCSVTYGAIPLLIGMSKRWVSKEVFQ